MGDGKVAFKDADGIINDDDAVAYFLVISDAWNIHIERERVRRGLWKDYPAKDQFNQVKIKIDRIMRTLEIIARTTDQELVTQLKAEIESEGHDIINYVTFALRQL